MWTTFERRGGSAMIVGGMLWLLAYGMDLVVGVTGGQIGYGGSSPAERLDELLWDAGLVGLGLGVVGLSALIGSRSKRLSQVGLALGWLAVLASVANPLLRTGLIAFLGIAGCIVGTLVLGIATLRVGALAGPARVVPLVTGLSFFPLIGLSFPLESVVPDYVAGNVPFPIAALAFVMTGAALRAAARHRAARAASGPVLQQQVAV